MILFSRTILFIILFSSCNTGQNQANNSVSGEEGQPVLTGADQTEKWFPLVQNKRIGLIANQTSMAGTQHLVDLLYDSGFNLVRIFGPEHGFRGEAADGVWVENQPDIRTGIPVISLYGSRRKPTDEDLHGLDVIIFDIQDVGTRFYTYISTMTYAMEACAASNIEFLVLDRPNPNGDFVDGPVLEPKHSSFVGLHQVPVAHGMTVGEYAHMINEEGWLQKGLKCSLTVIPVKNYTHLTHYDLPVAPSPNLPNMTAIYLYPSLCFFEGTIISVGRGTEWPFQVACHPEFTPGSIAFHPVNIPGIAKNPPHHGKECFGVSYVDFAETVVKKERRIHLEPLLTFYQFFKDRDDFFSSYFEKLAGTDRLRKQIMAGETEENIRKSWEKEISEFRMIRKKYLLYPDFQ
jgi:uncharacterized protein YbbC (DUF1343 family)